MNAASNRTGVSAGGLQGGLQANWLPLSMIGIGLAWLAVSNRSLTERVAENERAQAAGRKIGQVTSEPGIIGEEEPDRGGQLVGLDGEPRGPAGESDGSDGWVHHAVGAARGALGSVREAGAAVVERASHYTGYAGEAGDMAKRAGGQLAGTLKRDPWLIGVAGLIVGGIAAALLPPTRIEQECFAQARDELWTKANELGHEAAERVRELADPAGRTART
jgi:hypothetical protein